MESFYQINAILTAGVSLTFGLFSLLTFLYKGREKVNLVFSFLCLLVVIFILLPPVGFILSDNNGLNSASIKAKRIFNFSFMGLLPWFIAIYTGFTKRWIPALITACVIISYGIMLLMPADNPKPLWVGAALITLCISLAHGFYAGVYQFRHGQKQKATWLLVAVSSFAFFNLFGYIIHLNGIHFASEWIMLLFPMNLCPLAFILIIGIQLETDHTKQVRMEKLLASRESKWQTLLEDIPLVILKTDIEGKINYINHHGVNLLKYKDASQILDTNWSDHCLKTQDSGSDEASVGGTIMKVETPLISRNSVVTKEGKTKIINWNSEPIFTDEGGLVGRIFIGSDITEYEEAIHQIKELKAELEKENLPPVKEQPFQLGMNQDTIGKSRPFIYAIQKCKQVAPTNASVLLLGETGVGKESFANLIQESSLRSKMPFVKVNCGALPAELIEDELFGHEKGAFTGAINSRMGRFEKANGGTIFLDEIGELPLVLQPKLLRVLQNGEFERVGGHQTIKVDVRIIAATNNDLEKEVRENRFREDLFYRLNVFPITIPPLRKRGTDIMLLIQSFIERKSKEHGKHFENISKADMNRLCDYEWPGNIRQLKNVIERAVISSENNTLKLDWFYEDIENSESTPTASLEEMETAYIMKVLQECRWKINGENGAAEKLVMHPNTLRSRMKKLNIAVPWKQEA